MSFPSLRLTSVAAENREKMEKTIKMRKVEVVEKRGKACPRSTRKKGRRGWEKSIELITIGPELKWDLYYFVMKTEYERR